MQEMPCDIAIWSIKLTPTRSLHDAIPFSEPQPPSAEGMATQSFRKLRDVVSESSTQSRMDPALANKIIFEQLNEVVNAFAVSIDIGLYKDDTVAVLEDLCTGKKIALTKSLQVSLRQVYLHILSSCPGYVVRNILNSMITVCNNKIATNAGRDTALTVLSDVFRLRLNDTASQVADALQLVAKTVKLTDTPARVASMKILIELVSSETRSMHDIFGEVYKIAGRLIADRSAEMRVQAAHLIEAMTRHSDGFTAITADNLLLGLGKGIEDEDVQVQEAACLATATIHETLVRTYLEKQEQSKIGAARGTDDVTKQKAPPSRLATLTKLTSTRKAVAEEVNDFKTVFDSLCKQVQKTTGFSKVGHLFVLGYFVRGCVDGMTVEDFELVPAAFLSLLQDPAPIVGSGAAAVAPANFTFEDQALLRTRLSFIFRSFFLASLSEAQLITVCGHLTRMCCGESRTDTEVQFSLVEANHILSALGSATVCVQDECSACGAMMLRHSAFGVRTAAANLLLSLALTVPGVASDLLTSSLTNTRTQSQQLLHIEHGQDVPIDPTMLDDTLDTVASVGGTSSGKRPSLTAGKMSKEVREVERMQRMYFFHGHALLLALLLKHAARLPQGLPSQLIDQVRVMGLELMQAECTAAPSTVMKPVVCSINRAGALIISSYLSLGYTQCRLYIQPILRICSRLLGTTYPLQQSGGSFKDTAPSGGHSSPLTNRTDEVLYEIMTVEAGLVVVTSLLTYCNDAVIYIEGCLSFCIDALEACFKNAKNKYQPQYRAHFRFRTFHTLLLEGFTLLPGGSYPNSCQHVYIEALKVLRDGLSNGQESSSEMLNDHTWLTHRSPALLRPVLYKDSIVSEQHYMLRLESLTTSLQKKECEAFLAIFGKEAEALAFFDQVSYVGAVEGSDCDVATAEEPMNTVLLSRKGRFQSSVMDARALDACVDLIASTFPHQAAEYQDKAVQLCLQAASQLQAGTLGAGANAAPQRKGITLFGNDEERKKKEKRIAVGMKTIVCVLFTIVQAFPVHTGQFVELEYSWRESLVDLLFDSLSVCVYNIQHKAARGLALFASKWQGSNIIQSVTMKIRTAMMSIHEKKTVVSEAMYAVYAGYMLALGELWHVADGDMRSLIQTMLADCLRKVDAQPYFQTCVLAALSSLCDSYLQIKTRLDLYTHSDERMPAFTAGADASPQDLLDSVAHGCSISLANSSAQDAQVLVQYLGLMIHLLSRAVALGAHIGASASSRKALEGMLAYSLQYSRVHYPANMLLEEEAAKGLLVVAVADTRGALNDWVCARARDLLNDPSLSIAGIYMTVRALQASLMHSLGGLLQNGAENLLLTVAEKCIRSGMQSAVCNQALGLEARADTLHLYDSMDMAAAALQCVWKLCGAILREDVGRNVEVRLGYWVLLLRAVALDLTARAADEPGEVSAPAGEEEDRDEAAHGGPADAVPSSEVVLHIDSFRSYVGVYRDLVTAKAPRGTWRMSIKNQALLLLGTAIKTHAFGVPSIIDLHTSRQHLTDALSAQQFQLTAEQALGQGCSLGLFLYDLISLACACCTYTLNEKTIQSFQGPAMQLLAHVVALYASVADPDQSEGHEGVLVQFLSQMMGALRACLGLRSAPGLLQTSASVLSSLTSHALVRDKVTLKRILKPFVVYLDEIASSFEPPQTGKFASCQCGDVVSFHEELAFLLSVGRLLYPVEVPSVDKDVQQAVGAVFQEHTRTLGAAWRAVVLDALRYEFHSAGTGADEANLELHPLRGGLLHASHRPAARGPLVAAAPQCAFALLVAHADRLLVLETATLQAVCSFTLLRLRVVLSGETNAAELHALVQVVDKLLVVYEDAPLLAWGEAVTGLLEYWHSLPAVATGVMTRLLAVCVARDAQFALPLLIKASERLAPGLFTEARGLDIVACRRSPPCADSAALVTLWTRFILTASQFMDAAVYRDAVRLGLTVGYGACMSGRSADAWGMLRRLLSVVPDRGLLPQGDLYSISTLGWQVLAAGTVEAEADLLEQVVAANALVLSKRTPVAMDDAFLRGVLNTLVRAQIESKAALLSTLEALCGACQALVAQGEGQAADVVLQAALPFALALLPNCLAPEVSVALLRLIMVAYAQAASTAEGGEERVARMTDLALPALLACVRLHQTDAQLPIVCGKALTLLARQGPEAFKAAIALLGDADRGHLQSAMRAAIAAEQAHTLAAPQQAQGGGGMRLNVDKYRK